MSRALRPLIVTLALFLATVSAAAMFACATTATADTFVPITGIVVRAEALTTGRGCGTGTTQIFKYVAVVFGLNPADVAKPASEQRRDELLAANVYDCFTDGLFVDLPVSAGSSDYDVQVYAYNQTAYLAAGGDPVMKGITTRLQYNRAALVDDGGPTQRAAIDADLENLRNTNPSFTTTCTAIQLPDVQALAVCKPFSIGSGAIGTPPTPAAVVLSTASFPGPDGGVVTCDSDYVSVRYRSGVGGTLGEIAESRCRTPTDGGSELFIIQISPAVAPASYTIEVALLRGDGTVLGQTTCGAETSPDVTSAAVCKPIQ